jgi:hypothetical protein
MDPSLQISIDRSPAAFQPGETLHGRASWRAQDTIQSASVRLFWTTSGKGTSDTRIVDKQALDNPQPDDSRTFSFQLPGGPPGFSGALISLVWGVELVLEPKERATHQEFLLGPEAREIRLPKIEPNPAQKRPWWRPV